MSICLRILSDSHLKAVRWVSESADSVETSDCKEEVSICGEEVRKEWRDLHECAKGEELSTESRIWGAWVRWLLKFVSLSISISFELQMSRTKAEARCGLEMSQLVKLHLKKERIERDKVGNRNEYRSTRFTWAQQDPSEKGRVELWLSRPEPSTRVLFENLLRNPYRVVLFLALVARYCDQTSARTRAREHKSKRAQDVCWRERAWQTARI